MKFEYPPTLFKSQWSWMGFSIIFWLIIFLSILAIAHANTVGDIILEYCGYLAMGSILFLLVLSIVETVLWKLGRLKETYS
jgi:hypothetical protein